MNRSDAVPKMAVIPDIHWLIVHGEGLSNTWVISSSWLGVHSKRTRTLSTKRANGHWLSDVIGRFESAQGIGFFTTTGSARGPYGHNYEVRVEVTGTLTDEGWVVDKDDITSIVSEWDHRFLLQDSDPLIEAFEASGDGDAVVVLDYPPTAEVMGLLLEERMLSEFPDNVSDVSVEVSETGELCATY